MSCIDCYDAAMDQCHCYFWERKVTSVIILVGLWVAIYFIVITSDFNENMAV